MRPNKYKIQDRHINSRILEAVFDFYDNGGSDEENGYDLADYLNSALIWNSPYSLQRFLLLVQDGIRHDGNVRRDHPHYGRVCDHFRVDTLKQFYSKILEIADEVIGD